jgi:hypothetical protein
VLTPESLSQLREWVRRNWKPLSPALFLIALNLVFLLSGWLAMFPPGKLYLRPMMRLYNILGVIALRLSSVLCLAALPLLLIGLFWALRRFSKQEIWQDDVRIAFGLLIILFMVANFLIPLVVSNYLLPDFIYPGPLTSATTDSHRYYLDVHQGTDNTADTFILHECDRFGLLCERVFSINAADDEAWDRNVRLVAQGDTLLIERDGRILYEYRS